MYAITRYLKSPLQRSTQLILHGNQRVLCRPMLLQRADYSKFVDGDEDRKSSKKSRSFDDEEEEDYDDDSKRHSKKGKKNRKGPTGPKIELRIIPALYPRLGYDEKNMKLGRQLSPHLRIYRKQLTSVMSIFLRISGFILALGIWIIGLSGLCCNLKVDALVEKIEKCEFKRAVFNVVKFCIVLPFAYHMVAGTRHLIWYLNVFLSKPAIYATGYVAIALTLLLAGGLTIVKPGENDDNYPKKVDYQGQVERQIKHLINDKGDRYEYIDLSEEDKDEQKNSPES
ncbi:uncharacterized protein LOC117574351 [Drosophila albomicans]|uniref:Uncharacterized protein LOC117574351 n=1 Tax=Drosophila albomicans TaxID=7291 RepID=A0A6P8XM83_DROAB|nr:uncharacterized protein LOC117574351 [Drosophila albomicans]